MRRRTVSTILALVIATYGTGLPQLVHMLTAHAGPSISTTACHADMAPGAHCCHHSDIRSSSSQSEDGLPADPGHDHDCPTCHFLSSALATALLPAAATASAAAAWHAMIIMPAARPIDPPCIPGLSQRGPPTLI